jgi:hypothetical protein
MHDIFNLRLQDSVTLNIFLQIFVREIDGNGCVHNDLRMQENCTMTQTSCKVCFTIFNVWKTRSCLLSVETSLQIPSIYCTALDSSINKPATSIVHLLWDRGEGKWGRTDTWFIFYLGGLNYVRRQDCDSTPRLGFFYSSQNPTAAVPGIFFFSNVKISPPVSGDRTVTSQLQDFFACVRCMQWKRNKNSASICPTSDTTEQISYNFVTDYLHHRGVQLKWSSPPAPRRQWPSISVITASLSLTFWHRSFTFNSNKSPT